MSYCIQARHDLVPMNPNFEVLVDGMISPLRLATLRFPKTIKVPPLRVFQNIGKAIKSVDSWVVKPSLYNSFCRNVARSCCLFAAPLDFIAFSTYMDVHNKGERSQKAQSDV